jgi:hypothetical protein
MIHHLGSVVTHVQMLREQCASILPFDSMLNPCIENGHACLVGTLVPTPIATVSTDGTRAAGIENNGKDLDGCCSHCLLLLVHREIVPENLKEILGKTRKRHMPMLSLMLPSFKLLLSRCCNLDVDVTLQIRLTWCFQRSASAPMNKMTSAPSNPSACSAAAFSIALPAFLGV